jgi:hypothetical protein
MALKIQWALVFKWIRAGPSQWRAIVLPHESSIQLAKVPETRLSFLTGITRDRSVVHGTGCN